MSDGYLSATAWADFKSKVSPTDPRLSDARAPLPGSDKYIQNGSMNQVGSFGISGTAAIGGGLTVGGSIGIGTPTPQSTLEVKGMMNTSNSPLVRINNPDDVGPTAQKGIGFFQGTTEHAYIGSPNDGFANSFGGPGSLQLSSNSGSIALSTGSLERMRITNSGSVGIGTTTPTSALDVAGPVRMTAARVAGFAVGLNQVKTGLNVNAGQQGQTSLLLCSMNADAGDGTQSSVIVIRHGVNGNNWDHQEVATLGGIVNGGRVPSSWVFNVDGNGDIYISQARGNGTCAVITNR